MSILKTRNYSCLNAFNIVFKHIEFFEMLEISSVLSKESMRDVKLALIDFIYRFKDKIYRYTFIIKLRLNNNSVIYCTLENGDIYCVFDEVMDFMRKYKLKPSIQLQEEYKRAPINSILFPDFVTLHEEIGISKTLYYDMVKK